MKRIRYFLEYLLVKLWLYLIKCGELKFVSDIASKFFQLVGMRLKATRTARRNLKMIFPELADNKIEQIVLDVWENFGRMAAETSRLVKLPQEEFNQFIDIKGLQNINKLKGKKALFFTAHLANWEILGKVLAPHGIKFHAIYRAANNELVDKLVNDIRHSIDVELIPKGKGGAKKIITALQNNGHVIMLVDQKMNDGIKVPFMGQDAMTAPAIASLALKYDCPIIPIQIIRKDIYNFEVIIHPELEKKEANVEVVMTQINEQIGTWVRAHPEQWFWLHRRWIRS